MANMQKVNCSDIKLGMRFTMPVFFDDGKNMFLARKHTVKKYHVNALQKWDIPFLLTAGEIMRDEDGAFVVVGNLVKTLWRQTNNKNNNKNYNKNDYNHV